MELFLNFLSCSTAINSSPIVRHSMLVTTSAREATVIVEDESAPRLVNVTTRILAISLRTNHVIVIQ